MIMSLVVLTYVMHMVISEVSRRREESRVRLYYRAALRIRMMLLSEVLSVNVTTRYPRLIRLIDLLSKRARRELPWREDMAVDEIPINTLIWRSR